MWDRKTDERAGEGGGRREDGQTDWQTRLWVGLGSTVRMIGRAREEPPRRGTPRSARRGGGGREGQREGQEARG